MMTCGIGRPISLKAPFPLQERGYMTEEFTCTLERPEQFKVVVQLCNAIHQTLDLTHLSVPSHFVSGEGTESEGRYRGNWSSQKGYQLLEVNWENWNYSREEKRANLGVEGTDL